MIDLLPFIADTVIAGPESNVRMLLHQNIQVLLYNTIILRLWSIAIGGW